MEILPINKSVRDYNYDGSPLEICRSKRRLSSDNTNFRVVLFPVKLWDLLVNDLEIPRDDPYPQGGESTYSSLVGKILSPSQM